MKHRVVISGLGAITPCGEGRGALWHAALEGRPAISRLDLSFGDLAVAAGVVKDFQPQKYVSNRKSLKVMCRDIRLAVAASQLARQDAGLEGVELEADRSGVCIGAGLFSHELEEMADCFRASVDEEGAFDCRLFGGTGMSLLFPLWLLKYLPNMPACHISITHGLRGPSNTITTESAASAAAFEEAYRIIERGAADLMFCGGAESKLNAAGLLRYHSAGVLARDPSTPLRVVPSEHGPSTLLGAVSERSESNRESRGDGQNGRTEPHYPVFSRRSRGLVPGEGGAILVLEELEHALRRRAPVYAEVAGAFSCVNTDERPGHAADGARSAAIAGALAEAKIGPETVDSVHLNAIGIAPQDAAEAEAVRVTFGALKDRPSLAATKPLTGFLGYAAAATEIAMAAMSLKEGRRVTTLLHGDSLLDGAFPLSGSDSDRRPRRTVLVNHFVSGLSNHSIVLKAFKGGQA